MTKKVFQNDWSLLKQRIAQARLRNASWISGYTMSPNAQDAKMMRALVKINLNRSLVDTLDDDIAAAIEALEKRAPVSESERKRVKTSVTH